MSINNNLRRLLDLNIPNNSNKTHINNLIINQDNINNSAYQINQNNPNNLQNVQTYISNIIDQAALGQFTENQVNNNLNNNINANNANQNNHIHDIIDRNDL